MEKVEHDDCEVVAEVEEGTSRISKMSLVTGAEAGPSEVFEFISTLCTTNMYFFGKFWRIYGIFQCKIVLEKVRGGKKIMLWFC